MPQERTIPLIISVISSGEQFDAGLVDVLCHLNVKVVHIEIAIQNARSPRSIVTSKHENGCNPCNTVLIKVPNTIYLKRALAMAEELSNIVIIPRNSPVALHLRVLLKRFTRILKLKSRSKTLKHYHEPRYILWYSPSPAYIFKIPYYFHLASPLEKITLIFKGFMNIFFHILISLAYDGIIVRDPPTYELLRSFSRNIVLLLPYMPRFTNKESCTLSALQGSICSVISIKRRGVASKYEERYLRLLLMLANASPETKFVVIGTSQEEAESLSIKSLNNVVYLGRVYGSEYYNILSCCRAFFAYIELPGTSNRIAESIAYGKPIITSKLASYYHIGLKHLYTAIIIKPNDIHSIKDLMYVLRNDGVLQEISRRLGLLHELYLRWNINQLERSVISIASINMK